MQFVYELQKAQKPFELMLYPKSRHGVTDPLLVKHLRTMMFDFVVKHCARTWAGGGTVHGDGRGRKQTVSTVVTLCCGIV